MLPSRETSQVSFRLRICQLTLKELKRLGSALFTPNFIRQLRRASLSATDVEGYLAVVWETHIVSLHIRPIQNPSELREFIHFLEPFRLQRILEIGTARGGTLYLFARIATPDAILMSIDLPGGLFGKGYPLWKIPLYRSFALHQQTIHLERGNSHDDVMLRRVNSVFRSKFLDFLFIDGDHKYEGVKRDFEMYSPFVRPGGIISFHDIVPGNPSIVGGVPQFWAEIKTQYEHREIVDDWQQGGFGIGILIKS